MKNFLRRNEGKLITAGATIIAAGITALLNPNLITVLIEGVSSIGIYNSVRRLEPLETGKYIGDLPNDIYGFAHVENVAYEITTAKPHWKSLKLFNQRDEHYFELQKHDNNHYLIGFIGADTFSRIGEITGSSSVAITLSPYKWGTEVKAVEILLNKIESAESRPINVNQEEIMYVLDLKEV